MLTYRAICHKTKTAKHRTIKQLHFKINTYLKKKKKDLSLQLLRQIASVVLVQKKKTERHLQILPSESEQREVVCEVQAS